METSVRPRKRLAKNEPKQLSTHPLLNFACLSSIIPLTLILSASLASSVLPPPLSALTIPVQLIYGHGTPHSDVRLSAASGTFKWRVTVEIDSPAGPEIGNFMVSLSYPASNGSVITHSRSALLPGKTTSHFNSNRPHVVSLTDRPVHIPSRASLTVGRPDWAHTQREVPINALSIILIPQKGWVHYIPRPLLWIWAVSVGWGLALLAGLAGYFAIQPWLPKMGQAKVSSSDRMIVAKQGSGSSSGIDSSDEHSDQLSEQEHVMEQREKDISVASVTVTEGLETAETIAKAIEADISSTSDTEQGT